MGSGCGDGYEPLFTRIWFGTKASCDCLTVTGMVNATTVTDWSLKFVTDAVCTSEQTTAGCSNVTAWPAMYQNIFKASILSVDSDFIFCGKLGGTPFQNVTRPNIGGECPTGTSPCIPYTKVDEMLCYPDADHATSCAITEITFILPEEKTDEKYSNYTMVDIDDTHVLIYSKSITGLPLTSLQVQAEPPCLNPLYMPKAAA